MIILYHLQFPMTNDQKALICDPQTSGGLLVTVRPEGKEVFESICQENDLNLQPIGELVQATAPAVSLL